MFAAGGGKQVPETDFDPTTLCLFLGGGWERVENIRKEEKNEFKKWKKRREEEMSDITHGTPDRLEAPGMSVPFGIRKCHVCATRLARISKVAQRNARLFPHRVIHTYDMHGVASMVFVSLGVLLQYVDRWDLPRTSLDLGMLHLFGTVPSMHVPSREQASRLFSVALERHQVLGRTARSSSSRISVTSHLPRTAGLQKKGNLISVSRAAQSESHWMKHQSSA